MQHSIRLSVDNSADPAVLDSSALLGLAPGIWLIGLVFQGWGSNGSTNPKTAFFNLEGAAPVVSGGAYTLQLPPGNDSFNTMFVAPALHHVTALQPSVTLHLQDTSPVSTLGTLTGELWIFAERVNG